MTDNEPAPLLDGRTQRAAEVELLIARALDPADPYDGHHGDDRTAGA